MATVIQTNVMVHARVVGPMDERVRAINTLSDYGWHITRSGPLMLDHVRADATRYEFHAERVLMQGEDARVIVSQIEKELT